MGPREELRLGRAMDGAARTGTVGSFGAARTETAGSFGARAGWHLDPDSGLWMRDTIHSMARRCRNWDYFGKGVYLVTIVLNDRSKPIFGRLRADKPIVELTELGRRIESHFRRISGFTPEIEVLGLQIMPEHLHGVLRVTRRMAKPLGEQLRGFKIGATKIARELGCFAINGEVLKGEAARGRGLFADGFTDTILFDEAAIENGLAYVADNPRRLWVKRQHPELFRVLSDIAWKSPTDSRVLRFSAIGNRELLNASRILQVQCSRRYFEYKRDIQGNLLKGEAPRIKTPEFDEKCESLLAAAEHGVVLVSPCISHGEREIARRAHEKGAKVITLANKGFNPLYKPGGRLFDPCADGKLLMLAPINWPYIPGEKKMTRRDACTLNRIAQLIAGDGAVEIDYKGSKVEGVDDDVVVAAGGGL